MERCLAFLILIATIRCAFAAEPSSNPQSSEHPVSEPKAAHSTANPEITNDLTFGRSTSGNVTVKPKTDYSLSEDSAAAKKLGRISELRGEGDQWAEVARLLEEVKNSDAGVRMKTDVKRIATLELAGYAEKNGQPTTAIQYLAEYVERYSEDEIIPEILLRQAYLFRKMGAFDMAISKLHLVMTAALKNKADDLDYLKRVVLTAQTELGETYFINKHYKEAAEMFSRLLTDPDEELNVLVVRAKLIRSLARNSDNEAVVREAKQFLKDHASSEYQAEIRYLLAIAHKGLGEKQEALRELLLLLEAVEVAPPDLALRWKSWKMAAGNEIGNQLFLEGDYIHAVQVYRGLVNLDEAPEWKLPLQYQVGLCFERLVQPEEALKAYSSIIEFPNQKDAELTYNLRMVISMAQFRYAIISWAQALEQGARGVETKVADRAS